MEVVLRKLKPQVSITAEVKGRSANGLPWKETADITSVSSTGAGFFIKQECPVGRLVTIMLPMPNNLRCYDLDKKLYRVWGLVQYCYEADGEDGRGFHVGVAFSGKDAPNSYQTDPMQSYRVSGMGKRGFWIIEPVENPFTKRQAPRYWCSVEVTLFHIDREGRSLAEEPCLTENISETGASVFSSLRVNVGDSVKLHSMSPPYSGSCIVRGRRMGDDGRVRVHLEFLDDLFPILEIEAPIEEEGEH